MTKTCKHKGCRKPAIQGAQYCYYSHDGSSEKPPRCLVDGCKSTPAVFSNLCSLHQANYHLWRSAQDLSKITGESSVLSWLLWNGLLGGAK